MTTHNLRRLRQILSLTQKELAELGKCSRHLIQSVEIGRTRLSTKIASRLSENCGVDFAWLTSDDSTAPIDHAGRPYSSETFERRKINRRAPDASHYRWRQLQLGTGFDLLHRLLAANRLKGKDDVDGFMERFEKFIKTELSHHVRLEDAVYGERRRATEAARKKGKIIALGLLTPFDDKPFRRGRERLGAALAALQLGSNRRNESRVSRMSRNSLILNPS